MKMKNLKNNYSEKIINAELILGIVKGVRLTNSIGKSLIS